MSQTFNHLTVTAPGDLPAGTGRDELLGFYAGVLGWRENPGVSIPGRRIFLRAPSDAQYGGLLHVFRLPLTLELAYLARDGDGRE